MKNRCIYLFIIFIIILYIPFTPKAVASISYAKHTSPTLDSYRSDSQPLQDELAIPEFVDNDADRIDDVNETRLGLDPNNIDSDCDYIDDQTELGPSGTPKDTDGDGLIDALENRFADSDLDGIKDDLDPTSGVEIPCARFTPFALSYNGVDSARLEIRIVGGNNVTAVSAVANQANFFFPKVGGAVISQNAEIQLFDDGTNGDRVAGDQIWTRDQFTADINLSQGKIATFRFNVVKVTQNGTVKTIDLRPIMGTTFADVLLGVVNQTDIQAPTVIDTGVQKVSNLVNFSDPWLSLAVKNANDLKTASIGFYVNFADDYDFLFFFPDSPSVGAPFGKYFGVKNDVQHIGLDLFDNTASFGSAGKLQGVVFLNFDENGPTLHEVMHRWAAHGLANLGFGQCGVGDHWGPAGVGLGQLGGFDSSTLIDNGNGTYTAGVFGLVANGGDTVAYAPLERYLAGFVDTNAVPTIKIPVNVDCKNLDYSVANKTTFRAGSIKTVTINDVMTQLGGARVPSFADAPKSFRAATIVVSQYLLSGAEMAFFNERAKLFGAATGDGFLKSFAEATDGVAVMNTAIGEQTQKSYLYLPIVSR